MTIIVYFFSNINSYNLDKKIYMSQFFSFFYDKIVFVIYSMLNFAIKNLVLK